ncbi:hypothetical protein [Parapedobacter lycopersici]|uniref:hypothetical protein n=1 Tax=Parapedobacter lycopersici TaxID=1864939 RepID=UPI00214DB5EB|nr:hypothetical protein [Parapedobacter lycopersici]
MQQQLTNVIEDSEWTPDTGELQFPTGLTVLISGNYRWEDRLIANTIALYFPDSKTARAAGSDLREALHRTNIYELVVLDEMLLCGDDRMEILRALECRFPKPKIAVYGTRFFSGSPEYPLAVDLHIPKTWPMDELARRVCLLFQ